MLGVATHDSGADEGKEIRRKYDRVDVALLSLPAENREILLLGEVEGLSYAEMAIALENQEGTVKSRCSRGRGRLAELLGVLRPGDDDDTDPGNPAPPSPVPSSEAPRGPPAP